MKINDINQLNWQKVANLMPAVVQDASSGRVLMLGYMNQAALAQTIETQLVTFYSRTRQKIWVKGETSGNTLQCVDISCDCDQDSLLVLVKPTGPCCHQGTVSCFTNAAPADYEIIQSLQDIITQRQTADSATSYTKKLLDAGLAKVSQKVGEEAVETVVAALAEDDDALLNESADLLYHLLVLLKLRKLNWQQVLTCLAKR